MHAHTKTIFQKSSLQLDVALCFQEYWKLRLDHEKERPQHYVTVILTPSIIINMAPIIHPSYYADINQKMLTLVVILFYSAPRYIFYSF
jgi:hypothetical protein